MKRNWVKFLAAFAFLALAVGFVGCGGNDDGGSGGAQECTHSFTEYVSNGDATCTEDGTKTASCDNGCGETDTVVDEGSAACSFTNYKSNNDATCMEDGTKTAECDHGCGETDTVVDEGSAGHTYKEGVCSDCGKLKSEGLAFIKNNDNTSYSVIGIGTCKESEIVIPKVYKGLPVTTIGEGAFSDCWSLTSVDLGNSVTTIGDEAFAFCSSLTSVDLSNSVTTIGDGAFFNCLSLTSVDIGNSVTAIDTRAFSNCHSLTEIVIPDSVITIGDEAFGECFELKEIVVDKNNTSYKDMDGNLYTKDGTTLIQYAIGKTATNFTILNGVTTIGKHAFDFCYNLTEIVISDSVTTIGEYAFGFCYNLMEIVIPDRVTTIGSFAFSGCDSLTEIIIPDSVTTIGKDVFNNCEKLIIYCRAESQPSGWHSEWNPLYRPVVWNCDNNDVADDGYIYTVIERIRYALKDGQATVVRQASDITTADIVKSIIYKGIEYNVTTIDDYAFEDCDSLTRVVIPDSITTIGYSAFQDCDSLTEVIIPDSVTTIGGRAFSDCYSLTIYCETESKPSGWNSSWNITSCPVVWDCNNNDVAKNGYIYTVVNGIRYGIKDGFATVVRQISNITTVDIAKIITYKGIEYNVTTIGEYAFSNCHNLTEIIIPDSITCIGKCAFVLYGGLTSVTFEDTSNWCYSSSINIRIDVTDPSANATYFKDTYHIYNWCKL